MRVGSSEVAEAGQPPGIQETKSSFLTGRKLLWEATLGEQITLLLEAEVVCLAGQVYPRGFTLGDGWPLGCTDLGPEPASGAHQDTREEPN